MIGREPGVCRLEEALKNAHRGILYDKKDDAVCDYGVIAVCGCGVIAVGRQSARDKIGTFWLVCVGTVLRQVGEVP